MEPLEDKWRSPELIDGCIQRGIPAQLGCEPRRLANQCTVDTRDSIRIHVPNDLMTFYSPRASEREHQLCTMCNCGWEALNFASVDCLFCILVGLETRVVCMVCSCFFLQVTRRGHGMCRGMPRVRC